MTEELLIKRAKKGDSKAFSALLNEHLSMIYNIAYRMTGNPDDASDMTQEVMIKIFKNLDSFNQKSKFSTWVYRVATNTCLDELKKIRRKQTLSLDAEYETDDGSVSFEQEDLSPSPDEQAETNELKDIVARAITRLGEEHRVVIVLRDIKGLSYVEIAEILNCSDGTVKSRLSRARARLKEILEKDFNIDGTYFGG